jgi:hypothetical protein
MIHSPIPRMIAPASREARAVRFHRRDSRYVIEAAMMKHTPEAQNHGKTAPQGER